MNKQLLYFFLLFCPVYSFCQTTNTIEHLWGAANKAFSQKKYEKSEVLYTQFVAACTEVDSTSYAMMGQLFLAKTLFRQKKYQALETSLNRTKKYGEQHSIFQKNPDLDGDFHFWKGQLAFFKKNYEEAGYYFEKTLHHKEQGLNLMPTSFELYSNLGRVFHELGDYKRAIAYFQKSDNKRISAVAATINKANKGLSLLEMDEKEEAIAIYKDLALVFSEKKQLRLKDETWGAILNNAANIHIRSHDYEMASKLLKMGENLDLSPENEAKSIQEYGNLAIHLGEYEKGDSLLTLAFQKRKKIFGNKHPQVASTLRQIGQAYASQNKHDKALLYYQKALTHLSLHFSDSTNYTKNPPLEHINSHVYLLKTLRQKATALTILEQVPAALHTLQLADQLLDTMRINYLLADGSKYFWLEQAKSIYEAAIPLALSLNQVELAFHFSQKSHGLLLREGIQALNAQQKAILPDSLISKEKELKFSITNLELQLFEENTDNQLIIEEKLFDVRRQLELFQSDVKRDFPSYFQQKKELPTANIATIQQELKGTKTALVEYFLGENKLYYFVLTQNDIKVYTKEKPTNFKALVTDLRATLSKNNGSASAFTTYTETALALYQLLMKDIITDFPKVDNFVIIPDEELGYLPFGAFLSAPAKEIGRYDWLNYLVNDYNFSYNYSSVLFLELNKEKKKSSAKNFVGFAPTFSGSSTFIRDGKQLDSLLYNTYEVALIDSIVRGKIYMDTTATLDHYLSSLNDFKITHLSTHANCNDENPAQSKLHFYDKDITALEIYNLNLNTELAVLSACETGVGLLRKGEGIMSLARSFMHAGCPSVVTSLWKVNDEKTAYIMKYFYENLHEGQAKEIALCEAQRSYVKGVTTSSLAHPYYWATFVQIGNAKPILNPATPYWYWVLGFLGICIIVLFLKKSKKIN